MSTITETLKAKLDELDLDRRVDELTDATEKTLRQLLGQVGELAHDNRERVSTLLDKAGTALDERTDGRYAAQFGKVREQVVAGVDKLATKRPANAFEGEAADGPQDAPADWADMVQPVEPEQSGGASAEESGAPSTWGNHTDQI